MTFCRNFRDEELTLFTPFTVREIKTTLAKRQQHGKKTKKPLGAKEDNKTAKTATVAEKRTWS